MKAFMRRALSRVTHRFRTLQWRLTLTYMLVTVLTVTCLPAFYSLASYVFVIRLPGLPRDMASGLETVAPQTLPYVVQTPPDRAGLHRWLVDFNTNGRVQAQGNFADLWMSGPPYGTSTMTVVDTSGRVIATTSPATAQPGELITPSLAPAAQRVVRAALADDTQPADLATPERDGRSEIAVPIAEPGHVLGALVLDMDVQATQSSFLSRSIQGLLGFMFVLAIGTGIVGLVFGYVTARWLTRRLRGIESAAGAWSRGDFAATARDPSGDELGRLTRDLNRMAEQLKTLLEDRQQLAIVEERNRLARELHDSVKQQVFATAMQLAAAQALADHDPAATRARLTEAEKLVGQAQQELNALIRELRPAALGDKGLAAALRELCVDWSRGSGITAEVRTQGERSVPLETEQALFRVAQEALSNVARHSAATAVDVHLAWRDDELALTIADNGAGFDDSQRNGTGYGLGNMRERVEALGGTLLVYGRGGGAGGSGTRVEARVPLPPPTDAATARTAGTAAAARSTEIAGTAAEKGDVS